MSSVCKQCKYDRLQCRCSKVIINKPVEVKTGKAGNEGLDAYRIAVLEGFEGDREEWLASLQGEKGDDGDVFLPIFDDEISTV